jgi:hypothetical protein
MESHQHQSVMATGLSSHGKHHGRWIFTIRFPKVTETRDGRSIHGTMITTPGYGHDSDSLNLIGIVIDKSRNSMYFPHGCDIGTLTT